jgi:hypothetical protein
MEMTEQWIKIHQAWRELTWRSQPMKAIEHEIETMVSQYDPASLHGLQPAEVAPYPYNLACWYAVDAQKHPHVASFSLASSASRNKARLYLAYALARYPGHSYWIWRDLDLRTLFRDGHLWEELGKLEKALREVDEKVGQMESMGLVPRRKLTEEEEHIHRAETKEKNRKLTKWLMGQPPEGNDESNQRMAALEGQPFKAAIEAALRQAGWTDAVEALESLQDQRAQAMP